MAAYFFKCLNLMNRHTVPAITGNKQSEWHLKDKADQCRESDAEVRHECNRYWAMCVLPLMKGNNAKKKQTQFSVPQNQICSIHQRMSTEMDSSSGRHAWPNMVERDARACETGLAEEKSPQPQGKIIRLSIYNPFSLLQPHCLHS